jgi:nucleoid-associated protein YgaU
MSKEAKIGLAVISVLLIVLGGVVAWRLKTGSSATTAQANPDPKEKSKIEAPSKGSKIDAELAKFKWKSPRDAKESPKVISPASSSDQPPERGYDKDSLSQSRQSAGEATAISPPPSMMPEPPVTDRNVDPTDRYGLKLPPNTATPPNPKEPPRDATVASGGKHSRDPFGTRSEKDYRLKESSAVGNVPPDIVPPGNSASALRDVNPNAPSPNNPNAIIPNSGNRYAVNALSNQPATNYRDNPSAGFESPARGSEGSFAGHRRHRRDEADRLSNEPGYNSSSGIRADGTYEVQPLDNFWTVSQKLYGSGSYYKALEEFNRGKSPDGQLKVGQNILAPEAAELEKKYPNLCPKANHLEVQQNQGNTLVTASNLRGTRSYTVAEGDTLFDIARYELGKASRWAEIYELNRNTLGKDFDYLVPGTQLALPQDAPQRPDPVTRLPGATFQR